MVRRGRFVVAPLVFLLLALPGMALPAGNTHVAVPEPGAGVASPSPQEQSPAAGPYTWTNLTSGLSTSPPPRSGAAMAYDPLDHEMVLFGGETCDPYCHDLGDTWTYSGGTWTNITATAGTAPSPRSGALMTYDATDGYLFLFGATIPYNQYFTQATANDTWAFSQGTWKFLGYGPALPIYGPEMAYDPTNGYVVFTGSSTGLVYNSATWSYVAGHWAVINDFDPDLDFDPMTYEGAPTSGAVIQVGGNWTYDFWVLSGTTWSEASTDNGGPSWAGWQSLAADPAGPLGSVVFMISSDVHSYHGSGFQTWNNTYNGWTNQTALSGTPPSTRTGTSVAYDPDTGDVMLFGGFSWADTYLGDTWALSSGPPPLLASASASAVQGNPPLTVTFNGSAEGGTAPYTWWWGFDTGSASGSSTLENPTYTFTTAGTYYVHFILNDSAHHSTYSNLVTITVGTPPSLSATLTATPSTVQVGETTSLQVVASGGTPPYSYLWSGLPPSCTGYNTAWLNCTPTSQGSFVPMVQVTDAASDRTTVQTSLTVVAASSLTVQLTADPSSMELGFTSTIHTNATQGTPPYSYAYSGLPGVCSSQDTAWLNCTPSTTGSWSIQVTVTDAYGSQGSSSATLVVTAVTTFAVQLTASPSTLSLGGSTELQTVAVGGASPYTYDYRGLPTGCSSQDSSWFICTPSTLGSWDPVVYVIDDVGKNASASASLEVVAPLLTAGVVASPMSGPAPLQVQFGGSATGGASPYTYSWAFGDGTTATGASVVHTYASDGTFVANLTVQDSRGNKAYAETTISVGSFPLMVAPTATPHSGEAPLTVDLDSNVTGGTNPYTVTWTLGDGGNASGYSVEHTYASPGTYTATATAVDADGNTASGSVTVYVSAPCTTNCTGTPPPEVTLSVAPDQGGAPLTVAATIAPSEGTTPYSIEVLFGDGIEDWVNTSSDAAIVLQHTYSTPGTYTVLVSLTDAKGRTASASVAVDVTSIASLSATGIDTPKGGTLPFNVSFWANVTGGTAPYVVQWTFGDGTSGSGIVGMLSYHVYLAAGVFAPELLVHDAQGDQVTVDLPYVHVNSTPPAQPSPSGASALEVGLIGGSGAGIGALAAFMALTYRRGRRSNFRQQGEDLVRAMETDKAPPAGGPGYGPKSGLR